MKIKKNKPILQRRSYFYQREYQAYQGHHLTSKLLITILLKMSLFFRIHLRYEFLPTLRGLHAGYSQLSSNDA